MPPIIYHISMFRIVKLPKETSKDQSATRSPWYRLLAEGRGALHTYSSAQLRYASQVIRMHDDQLPKKLFYGELQLGNRSQSGQMKPYKNTLKTSIKDFNIPSESWE